MSTKPNASFNPGGFLHITRKLETGLWTTRAKLHLCGRDKLGYLRLMRDKIEQGLEWWAGLSREEKTRWLQCAATSEEIDADLQSPDPNVRLAAGMASVGDAFLAFKSNKAPGR